MLGERNKERDVRVPGTECGPFQEGLISHHVEAHITISLMLDRCDKVWLGETVRQKVGGCLDQRGLGCGNHETDSNEIQAALYGD